MANLEVELTARINDLKKQLKIARGELSEVGEVAENTQRKTQRSFGAIGKSVGNANPAVFEFNRLIQDAPFGIQGAANNFQQLTQNIGSLTRQLGGAVPAIKAFAASLISGPNAILLGVSIVTSALVAFGDRLFGVGKQANDTEEEVKTLSQTLREYGQRLFGVAAAQFRSANSAAKELSTLSILRKTVGDVSRGQGERNKAVQELQRLYPSYFGNLSKEEIKNKELTTVYDNLTNSILKRARASAAQNLLTELFEKELQIQQEIESIEKSKVQLGNTLANVRGAESGELQKQSSLASQIQQTLTADQARKDQLTAELDVLKQQREELLNIANISTSGIAGASRELQKTAENVLGTSDADNAFGGLINVVPGIVAQIQADLPNLGRALTGIEALWFQTALNINEIGKTQLAPAISGIFSDVGRELAQGQNLFSAFGRGILNAFGGFLSQFGEQLVLYGVAALAFSKVSKGLLNPLTAGPSAAAAIAIGGILSAAGAALSSLGSGGLGSSSIAGQGSRSFDGSFSQSFNSSSFEGRQIIGFIENNVIKLAYDQADNRSVRQGAIINSI